MAIKINICVIALAPCLPNIRGRQNIVFSDTSMLSTLKYKAVLEETSVDKSRHGKEATLYDTLSKAKPLNKKNKEKVCLCVGWEGTQRLVTGIQPRRTRGRPQLRSSERREPGTPARRGQAGSPPLRHNPGAKGIQSIYRGEVDGTLPSCGQVKGKAKLKLGNAATVIYFHF